MDRAEIIDRYALPESETYDVHVVEVPAVESMRIGDIAGTDDRSGGADLVQIASRESVPDDWVVDRFTLANLLQDPPAYVTSK